MKLVLVTLFAALYCVALVKVSAISYKEIVQQEWESFKERHGKKYKNEDEERFRLKIFMENTYKIHWHNANAAKHNKSYQLGMNEYGDMLHHEFVQVMNGFKRPKGNVGGPLHREHRPATFLPPANFAPPRSVDWREHGYVTPVKNQGQCGSCWSFSATGALEGQHFRKTGKLVSLSEQNLVDCSREFGNNGCEGGLMDNAFSYIKANGGIDTEKDYPYEAKDDKCRFNRSAIGADDTGFVDVPEGDENALATAVASVGPVSVAIDASHESFQFYSEGIYDEAECSSTELDHGVLVVGYGETDGYFRKKKYWIVKNSWGESWGDKGYIKMARNHKNLCGIASSASYPLV